VIACGALAREVLAIKALNGLDSLELTCLPAILHNRPERIPEAVRRKIRAGKRSHDHVVVLYGDCGTGGRLDAVCAEEGVERIEGEHCYAFYLGLDAFAAEHEREIGTFYLTDYLVRHFDRLIVQGLGLDRFPELRDDYFGHYTKVLYLAQSEDRQLTEKARAAADRLGLAFERRSTGLHGLTPFLTRAAGA
jgi:sugar phosphate isomerase/epimerase